MMLRSALILLGLTSATVAQQTGSIGDWSDWRGPDRTGISREKGLPEKWSLAGQNLAWKAPYGGRSTPVILGDHLYVQNTASKEKTEQEQKRDKEKEPTNVEAIWKKQYGNGGELTWLFLALARAAGFEASGMWVADRRNYFFYTKSMDGGRLDANVVVV